MKKVLLVVGWLTCSFLSFGIGVGTMEGEFPYFEQYVPEACASIFGPFSLFGEMVVFPANGLAIHFKLIPLSKEESWKAYHNRWPNLDRPSFEQNYW